MLLLALGITWILLAAAVLALARAAADGDARLATADPRPSHPAHPTQAVQTVQAAPELPRRQRFLGTVDYEVLRAHRYERPLSVGILEVADAREADMAEVALRLDSAVRHSDVLGRVGDCQLAVLMPETSNAEAQQAASRVLAEVRERPVAGRWVELWAGIATLEPGDTAATLLRRADDALFDARRGEHGAVRAPAAAEANLRG